LALKGAPALVRAPEKDTGFSPLVTCLLGGATALPALRELQAVLTPADKRALCNSRRSPLHVAAALLHRWAECRGIELVEGLHAASLELLERWDDGLPFLPPGERKLRHRIPASARATPIRLLRGDVLELDWSDVDVAFACSTCFDAELMARISQRAEALRPGSVVVTYLLPGFCYYRLCRQPRSWLRRAALLQTLLGAILMPVSLALIMTKK
jgi:hypothetical protein